MRPTATTVPTAVCAIAPNSSEAATVVTASEPRTPPISDITHTTTRRAMPPCAMISPASTKNGTASSGKLSRPLNRKVWTASVGTSATNSTTHEAGHQQHEKDRQAENQQDRGQDEIGEDC